MIYDLLVVGGGAAGFYASAVLREEHPEARILILERGKEVLSKVRISGGGRCNVTHSEFDARALATHYPRGEKELLGPFHRYNPSDTLSFFAKRGVELKTEDDGRIFPLSNTSQTIIDCLVEAASGPYTTLRKACTMHSLDWENDLELWLVRAGEEQFQSRFVLIATGSSQKVWKMLSGMGVRIVPPVPSLFTFQIQHPLLQGLQGISQEVELTVTGTKSLVSDGPLLITHKGVSGPAVLRLSAWGALELHDLNYRFELRINWLPRFEREELKNEILNKRRTEGRKTVHRQPVSPLSKRLWAKLCEQAHLGSEKRWADLNGKDLEHLIDVLLVTRLPVKGKNTFKEEFVTAGGVDLNELDFRSFECRRYPHLYFAGEVINIDAITGGFNFQNAWTGASLVARHLAERL